jgi:thioredoxin
MATVEFNKTAFEAAIVADNTFVLVDFWAEWCGPCRQFGPIYERVSDKHPDITFAKVDTDKEQELSAMAGIKSIPTLMMFRDGVLLFNQAGAAPESALEDIIAQARALNMDAIRKELAATATSAELGPGTDA